MSSTTGDRRVSLARILLISVTLQAAGLLVFYAVEPLRKSRLAAGTESGKAHRLDRAAAARLRGVEEQRRKARENTPLKREDAEKLARAAERETAAELTVQLKDMRDIRAELAAAERQLMQEISERTVEDVSLHLYELIQPLATQLVVNATRQRDETKLPAGPRVYEAATALRDRVESERERLLDPDVFASLRAAHRQVQEGQELYIRQLDEAQLAYASDEDRIRRENHTEYLVNLMRDQIAGVLGETSGLDPDTMNDPPPDYEAPPPPPESVADESASVAELQQEARDLFEDMRALFAGARAADLAMAQHTGLRDAFARVEVPGLPASATSGPRSGVPQSVGELQAATAALGQAEREVNRLWQNARNLGAAGRAMTGQAGPRSATPPGGGGRGGARGREAARAAEGRAGRFADLTTFMYHSGAGEKGFGSSMGGGLDITHEGIRSGFAETGPGTPGSKGPPLLSEANVIRESLPGRMFSRSSPRTGWLYLDTWYLIGPWENHGHLNFVETHPPETLVHLDATYAGKGGRPLAWQFHQSDSIRIKPPDEMESSTYYGYTEVYFEEPMEMLVAVASDDAAKVWLNDRLIWQDDGMGPWRLDEVFRKVVFQQGFNTVLVRLENGPITCTFSVLLCPPDILL